MRRRRRGLSRDSAWARRCSMAVRPGLRLFMPVANDGFGPRAPTLTRLGKGARARFTDPAGRPGTEPMPVVLADADPGLAQGGDGETDREPGVEASVQGPHPPEPATVQRKRHPSARGFVRSSAVQNDLPLAGKLTILVLQFLGVHAYRTRYADRIGIKIELAPKIDDDHVLARIHQSLQLLRSHPGDP